MLFSMLGLAGLGIAWFGLAGFGAPKPLDDEQFANLYRTPLTPPAGPLKVFHIGHSLVGRDMPAMLRQLAGAGHEYNSQIGWGTTLKAHWGDEPINGFERENAHPHYRDAKEAAKSGAYNAFILTEMVEIRDAIKYFDSWDYLSRWANLIFEGNPQTRVYLYETWHALDTPDGWLERLDLDLSRYWETEILRRALTRTQKPIYVIPAGQVMARFVREIEARGGVGNIRNRFDLFAKDEKGEQDMIHINDLGAYLVALTHYAVLYERSPVGLAYELNRADGSAAVSPGADAAALMQDVVWQVVTSYDKTGVPQAVAKGASQ